MRSDLDIANDWHVPHEAGSAVPASTHAPDGPRSRDDTMKLREQGRPLRRAIPDVDRDFGRLHEAAMAPGVLDTRTKELVALALSVAQQCDGCITAHAREAARHGATDAEVAEVLGVTVMMGGGPATSYAPTALAAFREQRSSASPDQ